ncbi:MAG: IPT/TIG domain-containing protein, partial [Acidobacteriota bacterium]
SSLVQDFSTTNADLALSLSASGSNLTGTATTYTLQVTNNGPSTATEVRVAANLPSTGVLASATAIAGTCIPASPVVCDLGTLADGASATFTLVVNQLTAGTSTLTAQVSESQTDPTSSDNQAFSTATITGATYSAVPVVTSISPSSVLAGSTDTAVTITGSGFNSASFAQLDGSPLNSTVLSATQIAAIVPAASVASLGWHNLNVATPAPGGGQSSAAVLTAYAAIKAGANRMLYDPFSRRLVVSLGPSTPTGNSIEFITPATSTLSTPISIGDQPTTMALSSDGQMLYVLLASANRLQRFNMLTQQADFSMTLSPIGVADSSNFQFDVQPGTENTIALQPPGFFPLEIVDFDPVAKAASVRPSNTGTVYPSSPHFLDATDLLATGNTGVDDFIVNSSGIATLNTATISHLPNPSDFKIANQLLFTGKGGVADASSLPARRLGAFPVAFNNSSATVAPDPANHRAFFLADYDGVSVYGSFSPNGLAAFDTTTFLPAAFIPLIVAPSNTYGSVSAVDILRWGQDGVAALDSNGTIYLVRGPAVLPQLLGSNSPPTLDSGISVQHGTGNTALTLAGSNFQPGIAVLWNGSYRTTNYVDATHVTIAIPASDLIAPGSAALTASNPGSAESGQVSIAIN